MKSDGNELTLDNIGRRDFVLYQQKKGFRLGTDSVLLAWFASSMVRKDKEGNYRKASFLELGSGNGGSSLCVAARLPQSEIDCLEIMRSSYNVLLKNIDVNSVGDRMHGYCCDIRDLPDEVKQKQYDVVFTNPPFFTSATGVPTDASLSSGEKLAGRFEENGGLEDFIRCAKSRVIPSSGHIVMIMKANRLTEVMSLMEKYRITPVRILSIHPLADREASSVIIAGKVGAAGHHLKVLPPLILNENIDGDIKLTSRAVEIYEGEHKDCFI